MPVSIQVRRRLASPTGESLPLVSSTTKATWRLPICVRMTRQCPAALVNPVFVRSIFQLSLCTNRFVLRKSSVYRGLEKVTVFLSVALNLPNKGYFLLAFSNTTKSRAVETFFAESPVGSTKRVFFIPNAFALAFMALMNAL
ncbi:Uncharacterised protein [Vibrio cholerae]|nr:Uncharacterised protein [Vibrio cholerae]